MNQWLPHSTAIDAFGRKPGQVFLNGFDGDILKRGVRVKAYECHLPFNRKSSTTTSRRKYAIGTLTWIVTSRSDGKGSRA